MASEAATDLPRVKRESPAPLGEVLDAIAERVDNSLHDEISRLEQRLDPVLLPDEGLVTADVVGAPDMRGRHSHTAEQILSRVKSEARRLSAIIDRIDV